MNNDDTKLSIQKPPPASVGQNFMADEVNWQLSRLKTDSGDLLKQLMLEQQAKLKLMVQQLQPQVGTSEPTVGAADQPAVAVTSAGKTPLEDVVRIQQANMGHLDLLIERINVTIKTSLNVPKAD